MGKKTTNTYNLQIINPLLSLDWHPTKNGSLTPRDVTPNSGIKVWWLCKNRHEWVAPVYSRNSGGTNCPYCSGKRVFNDNCLQTINPTLAKQWHPTKNGSLTPRDVTPNAGKKVWWICNRGHEWKAVVASRNIGRRCPYCHPQTSQLELRIYTELKYLFNKVEHRKKFGGMECDVYIPALKVGIEVDGFYWHKDKNLQDEEKTKCLKKKGVDLIRLRDKGLKRISHNDIFFSQNDSEFLLVKKILKTILTYKNLEHQTTCRLDEYIKGGEIRNDNEYIRLLDRLPSPLEGFSLEENNNILSKEWHPTKNGSLTPRHVTPNSNKKVWWICKNGHEWQATITGRNSRGTNCPYCSGRYATNEKNLLVANPKVVQEWHPTKNGSLTPSDVTPNSHKKVWWLCSKGHEWRAIIANRSKGRGCPYCSNKAVCEDNCMQTVNPTLAKQWHPTKNGSLTPQDVVPNSNKKVWWLCDKGHEWKAQINNRNKGTGCPYCHKDKT